MMKVLWAIIKDGLQALAFWIVASLVMIYLWGYAGRMLSLGLGLIFLVCFIGLNLKRIVVSLPFSWARQGPPPPLTEPNSAPPNAAAKTCLACNGSGRLNCYGCNGTGKGYDTNGGLVSCFTCSGQGSLTCSSCIGRGFVYG